MEFLFRKYIMDEVGHEKEDENGKRSMVDVKDLALVPKKRSKKEKEKSPQAEVSKHEVNHFQHFVEFISDN